MNIGVFTLFPGWILSQTGGTIKGTSGKPYLRVFKYSYLSNFGALLRLLVKSLTKIDKSMSTMMPNAMAERRC
jgi:hypothetical protein